MFGVGLQELVLIAFVAVLVFGPDRLPDLARQAGRVITRERLLAEVWDLHWDTSTKTLDMHVLALRKKLHDAIDLTTVRGVGYRLEAV